MRPRTITDPATGKVTRTKVTPRSACGKFAYSSRKIAAAAAKAQTRNTGEYIVAYRCKRGCHCWHVGHPPGSRGEHGGGRR